MTVNGHPEVKDRPRPPADALKAVVPDFGRSHASIVGGTKQLLDAIGPKAFAGWMREQSRVLVTDTTMRDAHQSLLATRVRTFDMVSAAEGYATGLPQLLSLECWGGATFDVAMRFLTEDPWERLRLLRERVPNLMLQMLLRGANGVGYTNYADNVVRYFVTQAADAGVDVFRVFDCLNWVENMRVSIDAVCDAGKLAEGAICYTGDILDPTRAKYSLRYYVDLAKELEKAGCHILGDQGYGGAAEAGRGAGAGQGAARRGGAAGSPAHARHLGDRGGVGSGGGRSGRGCVRRGAGLNVGRHVAAVPRLAGGSAAPHRARHRPRFRSHPSDRASIGKPCACNIRPSRAT